MTCFEDGPIRILTFAWWMLKTRKTMVSRQAFPSLPPCAPLAFLSHLKLPFPSLSNACHAGYFGHKSFYRFGTRSCLATSHKQILKTPFNMTSSCILGFQATRVETWAHVYCTLANRKIFLRQITGGCKHNSVRMDRQRRRRPVR